MTKLIISTLAAAIAISAVSTTFAAPKQKVQRVPETGAESWQSRGNTEDAGFEYRGSLRN